MNIYTSGLIINQNTHIEKERRLPIKGKTLVNVGDEVNYDTIIAQGEIKGHLATFGFAQELNINPAEINKFLIPKIGDKINQGDIIGQSSSFLNIFKNNIKSPFTGTLEYVNQDTGNIGIRLASTEINLKAYIKGTVKKILPDEGAIIETNGTYIQGIFGIGGEKFGKLIILDLKDLKNTELKDTITVINEPINIDTIKYLESQGVIGIITGSISDTVIKEYTQKELGVAITGDEKVQITIILTEGFGNIPISDSTYNILNNIKGKNVSINGATQIRAGVIRPEIIMSKDNIDDSSAEKETSLKVGSKVRIMSEPYLCHYGYITKIFEEPILLETGNKANCVEIKLSTQDNPVTVPRTNIELII